MLNSIVKAILTFLFFYFLFRVSYGQPVGYHEKWIDGVKVYIVQVDLNSPDVIIKPAIATKSSDKYCPRENFSSFVSRYKPLAAINGTYHDIYTFRPVGTIIIDKQMKWDGERGTAVCFDAMNRVDFKLISGINGKDIDWSEYEQVICTGPTLVYDGEIYLCPKHEYFKDPSVYGAAPRSAIGVTVDNKFIMVVINKGVDLWKLARIMKELKCINAVTLDGGGSTALFYNGSFIKDTTRPLTNFIVVYIDPKKQTSEFLSKY